MPELRVRRSVLQILVFLTAAAFLSGSFLGAQTQEPSNPLPYLNPGLPISQRVDDLVSRMTLEEKASQLVNPPEKGKGSRATSISSYSASMSA